MATFKKPAFTADLTQLSKEDLILIIEFYKMKEKKARGEELSPATSPRLLSPEREVRSPIGLSESKRKSKMNGNKENSEPDGKSPRQITEVSVKSLLHKESTIRSLSKEKSEAFMEQVVNQMKTEELGLGFNLKPHLTRSHSKTDTGHTVRRNIEKFRLQMDADTRMKNSFSPTTINTISKLNPTERTPNPTEKSETPPLPSKQDTTARRRTFASTSSKSEKTVPCNSFKKNEEIISSPSESNNMSIEAKRNHYARRMTASASSLLGSGSKPKSFSFSKRMVLSPEEKALEGATVADIVKMVQPENNIYILSAEDALMDSPMFRRKLATTEKYVRKFTDDIKEISESLGFVCELGARYTAAMENITQKLIELKEDMLNPLLSSGLTTLCDTLENFNTTQNKLMVDIIRLFVVPAEQFVEKETTVLKELSKNLQKTTQSHEAAASRYSKKISKQQNESLEEDLYKSRSDQRLASLDYVSKLNEVVTMGKLNFLVSITGLVDANMKYHRAGFGVVQNVESYKEVLDHYLRKCKSIVEDSLRCSLNRHIPSNKESKFPSIKGYLFTAKKVKRGKPEGWERRFFTIDYGHLIQYKSAGDKVVKKRWNLLISSVKPRHDLERSFTFEVTVMSPPVDGKGMVQESLLLQAESKELLHQWLDTFQSAIMISISYQASKSKPEYRSKMSSSVRELLVAKNSRCVDCGKRDPEWASINLGIMMCIKCSGVHRAIGVPFSIVRSLNLDDWDKYASKLMMELSNVMMNQILEEELPNNIKFTKLIPESSSQQRTEFIKAKYVTKDFLARPQEYQVGDSLGAALIEAVIGDNLISLMRLILLGADVCTTGQDGWTPLHLVIQKKQYIMAQLLLSNGADRGIDIPAGDLQMTPLHIAASNADIEGITILIAWRADTTIKNKNGELAEDMAKCLFNNNTSVLQLFKQRIPMEHSNTSIDSLCEEAHPLCLERVPSREHVRSPSLHTRRESRNILNSQKRRSSKSRNLIRSPHSEDHVVTSGKLKGSIVSPHRLEKENIVNEEKKLKNLPRSQQNMLKRKYFDNKGELDNEIYLEQGPVDGIWSDGGDERHSFDDQTK